MSHNEQVKLLWKDALSGKSNRREVMQRGAALGLSAMVVAALGQESLRSTLAAEEGKPNGTFYDWEMKLHPILYTFGDEAEYNLEVASSANFSYSRFVEEANQNQSTWDFYGGITPFLEMKPLVDTETIEPWTPYVPDDIKANILQVSLDEGTYNGEWYIWPIFLDIIVQAWHAKIVETAGLDPEVAPVTWDEFISNAQKVQESGAAPYGLVFDNRDWRSLIPITHSFSTTDIYSPDGLFIYNSDAAVEAIETMKRMLPYTASDILAAAAVDNVTKVDEAIWSGEQAGYYFKYQNAPVQFAPTWQDPSVLRMGKLPAQEGTAGGTVFWNTGAGLLKYGANKDKTVEFMNTITTDMRMWQESIAGNPDEGIAAIGQLPNTISVWDEWDATPPDFVTANPWVNAVRDALPAARPIQPTALAITQFDVARPEWHKYLSGEEADAKTALTKAYDAARAEFKKQTGNDPQ